jgi:hypothetical protein
MDYKELLKLLDNLPDGALRDLSEIVRKNQEAHPNGVSYEEAKEQIERFKKDE